MSVLLLRGQAAEAVLWAFGQVRVVIETCGNKGQGRVPANAACSGSSNMMINIINTFHYVTWDSIFKYIVI